MQITMCVHESALETKGEVGFFKVFLYLKIYTGAEQALQGSGALAKAFQRLRHLSCRDTFLAIIQHLSASVCLQSQVAQRNSWYQLK